VSSRLFFIQDLCCSGVWDFRGLDGRGCWLIFWGCRSGSYAAMAVSGQGLPCRRILVVVISARPGLPSPSTTDASSTVPTIVPQTPRVTLPMNWHSSFSQSNSGTNSCWRPQEKYWTTSCHRPVSCWMRLRHAVRSTSSGDETQPPKWTSTAQPRRSKRCQHTHRRVEKDPR
jgi:hypothetical protein